MTLSHKPSLILLSEIFAVCRMQKDEEIPDWIHSSELLAIVRTQDELSIVCQQDIFSEDVICEKGWRGLMVEGPLDFNLVGVLASILYPLAEAEISVFTISTYNTDYVLVKEVQLEKALESLTLAGLTVKIK